ncbi:MAG: protein-tyrosine-phosphatase [Flavobacteriia bacterium]|nr:protein-tyrosine-phosphatase [Flavobacteriia bacterium]
MRISKELQKEIDLLSEMEISEERIDRLSVLENHLLEELQSKENVILNFICTHNSRRSMLSQVWSEVLSKYFELPITSVSGGTVATGAYKTVGSTFIAQGMSVEFIEEGRMNITFSEECDSIELYSKEFGDSTPEGESFTAVMTCADVEENCPYVPNAVKQISLNYEDPKVADGTPEELDKYLERSRQIGAELFFVYSSVKTAL